MANNDVQKLLRALECRAGIPVSAHLDADVWVAVVLLGAIVLFVFVHYLLKTSRPVKRDAIYGGVVFFSLMALIFAAILFHYLGEGYVPLRRGRKISICLNPGWYWTYMTVGYLAWLGLMAAIVSAVIRLRRPYNKYRKYTDLVQ